MATISVCDFINSLPYAERFQLFMKLFSVAVLDPTHDDVNRLKRMVKEFETDCRTERFRFFNVGDHITYKDRNRRDVPGVVVEKRKTKLIVDIAKNGEEPCRMRVCPNYIELDQWRKKLLVAKPWSIEDEPSNHNFSDFQIPVDTTCDSLIDRLPRDERLGVFYFLFGLDQLEGLPGLKIADHFWNNFIPEFRATAKDNLGLGDRVRYISKAGKEIDATVIKKLRKNIQVKTDCGFTITVNPASLVSPPSSPPSKRKRDGQSDDERESKKQHQVIDLTQ